MWPNTRQATLVTDKDGCFSPKKMLQKLEGSLGLPASPGLGGKEQQKLRMFVWQMKGSAQN